MNGQIKKSGSGAIACVILFLQMLIGPLHLLEVEHSGTSEMGHHIQSFSEHSTGEHSNCSDAGGERESHPAADHSDQLILPSHFGSGVDLALAPISQGFSFLLAVDERFDAVLNRELAPRAPPPGRSAAPRAPPIAV